VRCETCEEGREIDGDVPDCETDRGCVIPPLSYLESRLMRIYQELRFFGSSGAEAVLKARKVTAFELDILGDLETAVRELKRETDGAPDG
jgi:hypothetical protein